MDFRQTLRGKVALVTGASGGIGRGVALILAARGAQVAVNGRDRAKVQAVVDEIAMMGGEACEAIGDVRSYSEMHAIVDSVHQKFGGVDIVVANAGGNDDEARSSEVRGPFADINLDRVTAFVGQALAAKFNVVQAAIPSMRLRGGGSVIFVTSEGGRSPTPGQTAMASFSGGLIAASKVLAKDLAPDAIRVNCVCVTVIRDTPSWNAVFNEAEGVSPMHRKQYEKIVSNSPLGVADPADIGRVVAFFASNDSAHLTGTAISPTGGLTIH